MELLTGVGLSAEEVESLTSRANAGREDDITPPFVAEKFQELIPNTRLEFIEKCGHAPMMERPKEFNSILKEFLENQN